MTVRATALVLTAMLPTASTILDYLESWVTGRLTV
jgi:hypothetical protein